VPSLVPLDVSYVVLREPSRLQYGVAQRPKVQRTRAQYALEGHGARRTRMRHAAVDEQAGVSSRREAFAPSGARRERA
jgi:hypothetical protein